jgi:hypothetical protein
VVPSPLPPLAAAASSGSAGAGAAVAVASQQPPLSYWLSKSFVDSVLKKDLNAVKKGEKVEATHLLPYSVLALAHGTTSSSSSSASNAMVQDCSNDDEVIVADGGDSAVQEVDVNADIRCRHGKLKPDRKLRRRVWADTWLRILAFKPPALPNTSSSSSTDSIAYHSYAKSTVFPADVAGDEVGCEVCQKEEQLQDEKHGEEAAKRAKELQGE